VSQQVFAHSRQAKKGGEAAAHVKRTVQPVVADYHTPLASGLASALESDNHKTGDLTCQYKVWILDAYADDPQTTYVLPSIQIITLQPLSLNKFIVIKILQQISQSPNYISIRSTILLQIHHYHYYIFYNDKYS
jgi:hypothetical protein